MHLLAPVVLTKLSKAKTKSISNYQSQVIEVTSSTPPSPKA